MCFAPAAACCIATSHQQRRRRHSTAKLTCGVGAGSRWDLALPRCKMRGPICGVGARFAKSAYCTCTDLHRLHRLIPSNDCKCSSR